MVIRATILNVFASVLHYVLRLCGGGTRSHVVRRLFARLPRSVQADYVRNNPHILSDESKPDDLDIQMLAPAPVEPDLLERETVERIFAAFRKAKHDQINNDAVFLPSTMWQAHLDLDYPNYPAHSIDEFHYFLTNFGGLGNNGINWRYLVNRYTDGPKSQKYFEECIIGQKVRWWLKFESNGRDVSALSHPTFGNQWGAEVNNMFVSYESVLNDFYASTISRSVTNDRPVVGEVGAGYGILLYFLSRAFSDFCFLDFDLPETLTCATYYLMKCFPEKRFLLYGEGKLDAQALEEYDFIFMPSYVIKDLPDNSIDIFVNNSSLGEMKRETCRMFVREICRTADAFWHLNHEANRLTFKDGTASLMNREYPVPTDEFELVTRHLDPLNAAWKGIFDEGYDSYVYYYKKR